jgi:hypothetical protein
VRRLAALVAATAWLAACQGPPGSGGAADEELPVSGDLALVRVARWPAAGVELTLRVTGDDASGRDVSGAIQLTPSGGTALDAAARPVALAPGYTALLVRPGGDGEEEALTALLAARPPEEQLAIFRWGAAVDQVVGFTRDRARLARGLASALEIDSEEPAPPDAAALAAAGEVQEIGGTGPRVMRAVLVIGEGADEAVAAVRGRTAMPVLAVAGDDLMAAAMDAATAIDRLALAAHYTVAVCTGGAGEGDGAALSVAGLDGELSVTWPTPWPESLDGACDPDVIAAGEQAVPARFDLLFSDEQRAVYQERVAAGSKEEFELSVRLADDEQPIAASAHLHGKGTLGCDRKSYTLTLDGPGRHLFPDAYDDELFLIAMCADDRYLQLYTSYQLLAELGLFPLRFRYVELTLDGEERGVYLLIEKSDDVLERESSRVSAVLRRRFDAPGDHMEVEKATGDPAAASGAWDAFQRQLAGLAGDQLVAVAAERIDLDGFLTWVAVMTAFHNGDYVDEILATATDARAPGGAVPEYWSFTAWDNDDLFSDCHYSGKFAIVDPNELLYCVEGELEKILFADPVAYARYAARLGDVLDRLTPERVQQALDQTGAALLPWFERADICSAMTELLDDNPGASDPAEAQRDIREHLDLLRDEYESRRLFLQERLDALGGAAANPSTARTDWPDQSPDPSPTGREISANGLDSHYN